MLQISWIALWVCFYRRGIGRRKCQSHRHSLPRTWEKPKTKIRKIPVFCSKTLRRPAGKTSDRQDTISIHPCLYLPRVVAGNDYHHVRSLLFSRRRKKNDTVKKGEPAHFFCCVFLFSIVFICGYTFTISDFTHALIIASFASEHHVQNFCSMKDMVTPKNTFRSHPKKSVAWVAPSCSKPLLFCSLLFRQYSFYLSFHINE